MPGPIVPRPAPMPSAMALPALRPYSCGLAAWATLRASLRRDVSTARAPLVLLGDGAAEVDRGQGGEDEGLERGDQADLEQEEGDGHRARDETEDDRADEGEVEEDDEAAAHEQDQQVPGQDVGEESHRQRHEPDEVRDDFDAEDRDPRRALDAGRDPALQVSDQALPAHALDVVAQPDHHGQHQRDRDVGRRGVKGEAGDLKAQDVYLVLGGRRQWRYPSMFENQMNRKMVAMNGN